MRRRRAAREVEVSEYLSMCRRVIRAAGKRVGDSDPDALREFLELRRLVDSVACDAIMEIRESGFTWEAIGEALGVTRQAALMRWGSR